MSSGQPPSVCILDYGAGNVRSVRNLLAAVTDDVVVSNDPADLERASHLVLPGVGAFGSAMEKIRTRLPVTQLEELVLGQRKPFLGICVGMQVLAQRGLEFGEHAGLGWLAGTTRVLQSGALSLPHTGWNDLTRQRPAEILDGLGDRPDFYFVHSYVLVPDDPSIVVATTTHGESFAAIVQRDNVVGVQFHPEKSQHAGMRLMRNFLGLP